MPDTTPTDTYARRWQALLGENRMLQKQHLDLLTSMIPPFSIAQKAQVEANAAQIQDLSTKVRDLVNDWSADPQPM
jgi:hypothetical protein